MVTKYPQACHSPILCKYVVPSEPLSISAGTEVGFDQTEVTVTEGDTVTLSTSYMNNITFLTFQRFHFFRLFTQQGVGNATG